MEFPEPTIDADRASRELFEACGLETGSAGSHLRPLLAQAWEEGRWSPPGACMNPYGSPPLDQRPKADQQGLPGTRLLQLRQAAQAALAWVENMAPTVKRTALANQLRGALGLEPKP